MRLGRRLGNLLGGELPEMLPGNAPQSPFYDIRLYDKTAKIVRIFMPVPRVELLAHLYANGQYRQTKNVLFLAPYITIDFELEDTGGDAVVDVAFYLRDDPTAIFASAQFTLTGSGISQSGSEGVDIGITLISGLWYNVKIGVTERMSDQYKVSFEINGGDTRIGSLILTSDEIGSLRKNLDPDFANWDIPLAPNGVTPTAVTAYDLLDGITTYHDLFRWVIYFDEQLRGSQRTVFAASFSGPHLSLEGQELVGRGILSGCANNRVHLQWDSNGQDEAEKIIVQASENGMPFVTISEVSVDVDQYVSPALAKAIWKFRLLSKDRAGNVSSFISIGDFAPAIWIDPSNISKIFTDTIGTVQVLNDGDKIALIVNSGSLAINLNQASAGPRPEYVATGINSGAGIHIPNAQSHMAGGAAAPWLGSGQAFDIFTAVLLDAIPASTPQNSPATTTYSKIIGFESFFELIVADFSDDYFSSPENDYNTGGAVIARMYTGSGLVFIVLPIILGTITPIRAAYAGGVLRLYVGNSEASIAAPGPSAPGTTYIWGQPVSGTGLDGYVGPLVTFQSLLPTQQAQSLLGLIMSQCNAADTFIIPDTIIAPVEMRIGFSGTDGIVSANPSSTLSVTQYNLYHNNGTDEFIDFSTPAATAAGPGFTFTMTPGLWRIVMRASDGTLEDGNFENRLDVVVVEKSPGMLEAAGPPPNGLTQFEIQIRPAGYVRFSAYYRSWAEKAIGAAAHIWVFEKGVPIDTSVAPTTTMGIEYHAKGKDNVFQLVTTIIGPFVEVEHTVIARVVSVEGDYQIGEINTKFIPDATSPPQPIGLRGNKC